MNQKAKTDSRKQRRARTAGYAIASLGFLMILGNALNYLLEWGHQMVPLMIIGLVLVVTGMNLSRKV